MRTIGFLYFIQKVVIHPFLHMHFQKPKVTISDDIDLWLTSTTTFCSYTLDGAIQHGVTLSSEEKQQEQRNCKYCDMKRMK